MSSVPWYALSPSPMTLTLWGCMALYGSRKLGSMDVRSWVKNFCESALVIGLVVLPYDSMWQILQWTKYGYLYPQEWIMVINVLIRNGLVFSLCLLSSWKLQLKTNKLKLKHSWLISIFLLVLTVKFVITFDPGWTDWTYPMRFSSTVNPFVAYLSGLPDKVSQAVVYWSLWN